MQIEGFNQKEKKDKIIVVSNDLVMFNLLRHNDIKSVKYESAFELEKKPEEMKNSVVLVKKGIVIPENFECIRYEEHQEVDIIKDLTTKYEFIEEPEKDNTKTILKTKLDDLKEEEK